MVMGHTALLAGNHTHHEAEGNAKPTNSILVPGQNIN